MSAPCQQDMITNGSPEGLSRNRNYIELFCKYEHRMILEGFSRFLLYDKNQPIQGLDNINKHSIAWETLILKLGQNRLVKILVGTPGQSIKNHGCPSKLIPIVNRYRLIKSRVYTCNLIVISRYLHVRFGC